MYKPEQWMIELNDRYEECSECPVKEDCVFNRIVLRDPNGIYMKCPCRYCLVVIMCNEENVMIEKNIIMLFMMFLRVDNQMSSR